MHLCTNSHLSTLPQPILFPPSETKAAVFEAIYYFMDHEDLAIQSATLQALGSICIRHYEFMMDERLKQRYIRILTATADKSSLARIQVGPDSFSFLL